MNKRHLIIATRESPLALWQANWVKERLQQIHPYLTIQLLGLTTSADNLLSISLKEVGGKGLFVKELEEALLEKRADIAVHSMKDVPIALPPGLCLPVMCEREEPRDVFVANRFSTLHELPAGAVIGTSSLRRQSQILALRPDTQLANLRGNVNTRLQYLDQGKFDAIILAAAGLKRLNLQNRIREFLNLDYMLPASGQGVLGIECRNNDTEVQELIAPLNHVATFICVTAERAMCKHLDGGCQAPIAAYAEIQQKKLTLRGLVAQPDGTVILRAQSSDKVENATQLGLLVANDLSQQGAKKILNSLLA